MPDMVTIDARTNVSRTHMEVVEDRKTCSTHWMSAKRHVAIRRVGVFSYPSKKASKTHEY